MIEVDGSAAPDESGFLDAFGVRRERLTNLDASVLNEGE
jgi:hypothetical protein